MGTAGPKPRATLQIAKVRANGKVPTYATPGAAGMDLTAALDASLALLPGATARIPTGIALGLPKHHEGQVRPRSGLAARHGVTVLNSPGTIDEDYRGEVQVLLINHGQTTFTIEPGDRIAQLVIAPVAKPDVEVVDDPADLGQTTRGSGGFGSTGR